MRSHSFESSEFHVQNGYAQEYLLRSQGVKLTASSARSYDGHLTEYVEFLNQRGRTVLKAEFQDVLDYLDQCVRRGNRESTLSSKLSSIAELYRYIRLRTDAGSELELDPIQFRDIDLRRYNTPEPIKREALTREELRQLFDGFDSYRNRLMAVVGVETGLRNSDIRNLKLEDIDEGTVHVRHPKNSRPYNVPISKDLSYELRHWEQHHRAGYVTTSDNPYMFPSQNGGQLESNGSLNQIVKDAAEEAGLQDIIGESQIPCSESEEGYEVREWSKVTVHTLRHSFITLLKDSGISLTYRMLVANHQSAETTRNYTHGEDELAQIIQDRFDPPR